MRFYFDVAQIVERREENTSEPLPRDPDLFVVACEARAFEDAPDDTKLRILTAARQSSSISLI